MGIEELGILLIHSNGPDESTTFVDSSGQGHTVTGNGDIHHESDESKFGTTAIHGDYSGDYLSVPTSSDFDFGTGDFTIDFWFNLDFADSANGLFSLRQSDDDLLRVSTFFGYLFLEVDGAILLGEMSSATWYHLAIVRYGNTLTGYLNGTSFDSEDVTAVSFDDNSSGIWIGRYFQTYDSLAGYIDEFRIVKGTAEWTSNFTPHSGPYEVWDGTVDSPEIVITTSADSDVQIGVDSPEIPVSLSQNPGDVYVGTPIVTPEIALTSSASTDIQISISQPEIQLTSQLLTDIGLLIDSSEAIVSSSTSLGAVLIGAPISSPELAMSLDVSSDVGLIIVSPEILINLSHSIGEVFAGVQIQTPEITLTSVFSSGIKVEHADFGIHELGVLLIHSDTTDGSTTFVDSSGHAHTINPNGDVHHEEDDQKFGATAIYFDGYLDYLLVPTSSDFDFGTGDFTVDFWFNSDDINSDDGLFTIRQYSSELLRALVYDGDVMVQINSNIKSTAISEATWYHLAVVRYGNTVTVYLNGSSFGTQDVTGISFDDDSSGIAIGYYWSDAAPWEGYIDEFRIVAKAVWTSNFTPFSEAYYPWDGTVQSAEIIISPSNTSDLQIDIDSVEASVALSHSVGIAVAIVVTSAEAIVSMSASSDFQLQLSSPEIQATVTASSDFQLQLSSPEIQAATSTSIDDVFIGIIAFSSEAIVSLSALSDVSLFISSPEIQAAVSIITNPSILIGSPEITLNTIVTTAEPAAITFTTEHADVYYLFTLTGAADSTTDIEIPIKSFQGRLRSGDPSYLSVVIPGIDHSADITARSNGDLVIEMAYKLEGVFVQREEIVRVTLEDIRIDQGARNQSISLSGHKTESYSTKAVEITQPPIYYNLSAGKIKYRFPTANMNLNPGDTLTVGTDVFTAGLITYTIGVASQQMEVGEA